MVKELRIGKPHPGPLYYKKKIGCSAANPQLLRGKPLYYGTMGRVNGNIYLRNIRLMLYWQKGNIIVALKGKPGAIALSPKVEIFSLLLKYYY